MRNILKSILPFLVLGSVHSQKQGDKTEDFECPPGSFIISMAGTFERFVNSITATCSDKSRSKVFGNAKGTPYSLPTDIDGITEIVVNQDHFVDSIGYNGQLVGGKLNYRTVEFVDIHGCAAVGFRVTYGESLRHLKFKFSCVNNALIIPAGMALKITDLNPSNCYVCSGNIKVTKSAKVEYIARVLSSCHALFRNTHNSHAVAQALENSALAGNSQATEIVRILVHSGNVRKCTSKAAALASVLSIYRYAGTAHDVSIFGMVMKNTGLADGKLINDPSLPYCDEVSTFGQQDDYFCDEVDENGVPFCDAVEKKQAQSLPFCDEEDVCMDDAVSWKGKVPSKGLFMKSSFDDDWECETEFADGMKNGLFVGGMKKSFGPQGQFISINHQQTTGGAGLDRGVMVGQGVSTGFRNIHKPTVGRKSGFRNIHKPTVGRNSGLRNIHKPIRSSGLGGGSLNKISTASDANAESYGSGLAESGANTAIGADAGAIVGSHGSALADADAGAVAGSLGNDLNKFPIGLGSNAGGSGNGLNKVPTGNGLNKLPALDGLNKFPTGAGANADAGAEAESLGGLNKFPTGTSGPLVVDGSGGTKTKKKMECDDCKDDVPAHKVPFKKNGSGSSADASSTAPTNVIVVKPQKKKVGVKVDTSALATAASLASSKISGSSASSSASASANTLTGSKKFVIPAKLKYRKKATGSGLGGAASALANAAASAHAGGFGSPVGGSLLNKKPIGSNTKSKASASALASANAGGMGGLSAGGLAGASADASSKASGIGGSSGSKALADASSKASGYGGSSGSKASADASSKASGYGGSSGSKASADASSKASGYGGSSGSKASADASSKASGTGGSSSAESKASADSSSNGGSASSNASANSSSNGGSASSKASASATSSSN